MINETLHRRRLRAEARFQWYGRAALIFAGSMLCLLLLTLLARGLPGFMQTQIRLPVRMDAAVLELNNSTEIHAVSPARFGVLAKQSIRAHFPDVTDKAQQKALSALISSSASGLALHSMIEHRPDWLGRMADVWLPASSLLDRAYKHGLDTPGSGLSTEQRAWALALKEQGALRLSFNPYFFSKGDSREPVQAGFLGAMMGSLLTLLICLGVAFPLGVMTAVHLQEFAKPGKMVDLIEVNINNLAAVPSIVFGLLGLAIYLNWFGVPRSSSIAGGLTLALMILPVIIIATRSALRSVPDSIRHAALALGASPVQTVWHHTLPLAMPGIMTGTILGIARALGETAPLLMIGMVAFIADLPRGFTDPATVMPVQIYLWAGSPEAGFVEKTAAGILTLLAVLMVLNAAAIAIRKRFEVRW